MFTKRSLFCLYGQLVSDLPILTCKLLILFSPTFPVEVVLERAAEWVYGSWPRSSHHVPVGEFASAAGGPMGAATYGLVCVLYGERPAHLLAYLMLFWKIL